MKLIEALEILRRPAADSAQRIKMLLATGFTPLHLQTFLCAHLRSGAPEIAAEVKTGLYGDLAGTLERLDPAEIDALAVIIEWSDLDPRLGVRTLGGWRPADLAGIAQSAEASMRRIERSLASISQRIPAVVAMPTLPLPPLFTTRTAQMSSAEAQLHRIAAFATELLAQLPGTRVASTQQLALASAPASRYDIKSDLNSGFPYTISHACALAEVLAGLMRNRQPMKGLITDLDDTLWAGIVGDDGIEAISWSLDRHTQLHGIYQQLLASFAGAGVLVGVASKNDAQIVERAFEREDLLISKSDIFPVEAHWSAKSESVARILKTWNIGADAVVFIDDNPMEVAEVKAAFPEMDCRLFPKNDYAAAWAFFRDLRDAFGKPAVTSEDALRLESIRSAGVWRNDESSAVSPSDDFLAAAEATIAFDCGQSPEDTRAFELINKTNQFNLNGNRLTESEWRRFFADPGAFLLTASYKDKFGPLGKVAVLMGKTRGNRIEVAAWVMSCRAFSRRIEQQSLKYLFDQMGADEIAFDYQSTPRNGPLTDFLAGQLQSAPAPGAILTKDDFLARVPALFHRVEVSVHV